MGGLGCDGLAAGGSRLLVINADECSLLAGDIGFDSHWFRSVRLLILLKRDEGKLGT